ncbi:SE1832 family protein [Staphylococcus gallinarum]|uniref:SE1832 family protein n=1 Tax=Staphylococcus gallinarum TaxID=1293 RepID=UPI0015FCCE35|nr:SE1832 family protein [Staphylococcus gallinarum]
MDLNQKLTELKHDYVRLQGDLEKRESVNQQTDPLLKQLDELEQEIAAVRSEISQKEHK